MTQRHERRGRVSCTDCSLDFLSAKDYSAHRKRDYLWVYRCLDLDAMLDKGMHCNAQGYWFMQKGRA